MIELQEDVFGVGGELGPGAVHEVLQDMLPTGQPLRKLFLPSNCSV